MPKTYRILVILIVLACAGLAPTVSAAGGRTTLAERNRIIALSKQYEHNMLAPGAAEVGAEIMAWWEDVDDYTVTWCTALLREDRIGSKALARACTVQALAAAGVYVLEHEGKVADRRDSWVAGLEGVVRAYRRISTKDAQHRDPYLEKLMELHNAGNLPAYVEKEGANCLGRRD